MSERINGKQSKPPSAEWLKEHAQSDDFLLAHALDGVIWGKVVTDKLVISSPLNLVTLQEIRLFNDKREIHLWRDGDAWYAYEMDETGIQDGDYIDEQHILWGTKVIGHEGIFTIVEDGAQGLGHSVPIPVPVDDEHNIPNQKRLVLTVRHYFGEDEKTGVNYIDYSRLVGLAVKEFEDEQQSPRTL